MKILHIIDTLGLGGAQIILKGILEEEICNDHYLFVLRKTDIVINIQNSQIHIHPSFKKHSLAPLNELINIIKKEKIDILHCHLFRSQVFGWLIKKRYFPNIKLVFHEHGRIFASQNWYNMFLKLSKSQVDKYLAVSKATKNYLINYANIIESKIMVLYNFVDLNKYNRKNVTWNTEEEREKLSISKDAFVVGFAGRLVKIKGWRTYIDAAELVSYSLPNAKFLIAGDGIDKAQLLRLIDKKDLNKNVKYIGYVSNMLWFYSLLDCLVIPSYWEASPMLFYETQAFGIPLVGGDVSSINELVINCENGLLFYPRDKQELAKKIELLSKDNKLRFNLINKGKKRAKKYSVENYCMNINRFYEHLM